MKNNVRIVRLQKNYTQAQLATLVQVSRQTINAIESGKYVPSTLLALKIAQQLEAQIDGLFELEDTDWEKKST